jgi:hypothetical protein
MLATGMAFGGGSALAHHAVGSMFGRSSAHGYPSENQLTNQNAQPVEGGGGQLTNKDLEQQIKSNPCYDFNVKFLDCLKAHEQDISQCQITFNDMMSCQKNLV